MDNNFKVVEEITVEIVDDKYVPVYKYLSSEELYKMAIENFDKLVIPEPARDWNLF